MKKLFALILVLGLAVSAQAAFQLSVDGLPAPDEITIMPSDWVKLDILIDLGTEFNGGDFEINVAGPGSLDAANVVFPAPTVKSFTFGMWFTLDNQTWPAAMNPFINEAQRFAFTGGHSQFNAVNNVEDIENPFNQGFTPSNSYPVLMDELWFHCDAEGDVIIELVAFGDVTKFVDYDASGNAGATELIVPAGTVLDTLIIHQIPEPMTFGLLGLGGLFLRRRRA